MKRLAFHATLRNIKSKARTTMAQGSCLATTTGECTTGGTKPGENASLPIKNMHWRDYQISHRSWSINLDSDWSKKASAPVLHLAIAIECNWYSWCTIHCLCGWPFGLTSLAGTGGSVTLVLASFRTDQWISNHRSRGQRRPDYVEQVRIHLLCDWLFLQDSTLWQKLGETGQSQSQRTKNKCMTHSTHGWYYFKFCMYIVWIYSDLHAIAPESMNTVSVSTCVRVCACAWSTWCICNAPPYMLEMWILQKWTGSWWLLQSANDPPHSPTICSCLLFKWYSSTTNKSQVVDHESHLEPTVRADTVEASR